MQNKHLIHLVLKEAKQRAKEIADNRGTQVIEHQKDE